MAAIAEARATIDGLGQSLIDWVTAGTNVTNTLTKARRTPPRARARALVVLSRRRRPRARDV